MSADYKEQLRRLALHDDHLIQSMLAIPPGHVEASAVDAKSCALVRLGALVALHRHAESQGGRFAVRAVPPQVQRLFEITRLDDFLAIE